jgi:hypothetical protein
MDFFYDGQIRRYVTQFMRIFIGFKYEAGNGDQQSVPVMYGDLTRQVANIIRENSENKLPTVPRMACYITGLEMDTSRLTDPTFVSKVNIRERHYNIDEDGERQYTGAQGKNVTVERLMPTPFTLSMRCDIWTSNTDQKLQLLEQILVLFNPALEIQTTDNYVDWTSLSVVYLTSTSFTSRSIPAGAESDIDICTVDFEIPIWISPPAKVKKLGVIRSIIANIFTEEGNVVNLSTLIYNNNEANSVYVNPRYPVLLFKANNGIDLDYELTVVDQNAAIQSLGLDEKEFTNGRKLDWNAVLSALGNFVEGTSTVYFKQPDGSEIQGTIAINPVDPFILLVSMDRDTLNANTLIVSAQYPSGNGTINAIIDPFRYNPIDKFNGLANIPTGHRFLMLEDINDETGNKPAAWKNLDGSATSIPGNSIIEWNGSSWAVIFDPTDVDDITYVSNLTTGIQYKWDGIQWLKSFEGEYAPGYWRFNPEGE